ncbi:MAG: hypothetical protein HRT86_10335 [Ilumatobacteraceae bacterium]|nr:hypothetical protein [Ilumatobacteraceae bacterium]
MALSKQDAQDYIQKYIDSDFDHVLTCSNNIQSIIDVSTNMAVITNVETLAAEAQASADSAAAAVANVIEDVDAGTGVTIDKTDPRNPIINVTPVTKITLGIENIDNTSDATKQTATLAAATATDVDLGNVDNTTDLNKPVSTATQTALDGKVDDSQVQTNVPAGAVFVDTTYSIGDGALTEINFTSTLQVKLGTIAENANDYTHPSSDGDYHVPATGTNNSGKVLTSTSTIGLYTWEVPSGGGGGGVSIGTTSTTAHRGDYGALDTTHRLVTDGNPHGVEAADLSLENVDNTSDATQQTATLSAATKSDVGLANVDNTADTAKPVSTAQQTALDLKVDDTEITNIDNTSDANKPISTATQTALDLKLDSAVSSVTHDSLMSTSPDRLPLGSYTGGDIDDGATVTLLDNTDYVIDTNIHIGNNGTLIIGQGTRVFLEAGVQIRLFKGVNSSYFKHHDLVVNGTLSNPSAIIAQGAGCTIVNNDGGGANNNKGSWVMKHCVIQGMTLPMQCGIRAGDVNTTGFSEYNAKIQLDYVTFRECGELTIVIGGLTTNLNLLSHFTHVSWIDYDNSDGGSTYPLNMNSSVDLPVIPFVACYWNEMPLLNVNNLFCTDCIFWGKFGLSFNRDNMVLKNCLIGDNSPQDNSTNNKLVTYNSTGVVTLDNCILFGGTQNVGNGNSATGNAKTVLRDCLLIGRHYPDSSDSYNTYYQTHEHITVARYTEVTGCIGIGIITEGPVIDFGDAVDAIIENNIFLADASSGMILNHLDTVGTSTYVSISNNVFGGCALRFTYNEATTTTNTRIDLLANNVIYDMEDGVAVVAVHDGVGDNIPVTLEINTMNELPDFQAPDLHLADLQISDLEHITDVRGFLDAYRLRYLPLFVGNLNDNNAGVINPINVNMNHIKQAEEFVVNRSNTLDVAGFVQGVILDAEKLATHVVTIPFDLPVSLVGSQAYAEVVSTAAATIDIKKNGSNVGTINFALGASTATFTFATLTSFAAGDRLSFVGQGTADATLADISFTIRGDTL